MKKPNTIRIGNKKYPIICNLNVLQEVQEKYGSINKFEMKLLGIVFQKNDKGETLRNDKGEPLAIRVEPSIDAVKTGLSLMIKEGERVSAYLDGKDEPEYTDTEILFNDCDIPFDELANTLHAEYKRCFESKKA